MQKDLICCLKKPVKELMLLFPGCQRVMQNTSLEFPFEYADIGGLGRLFYPVITAELQTIRGWRKFEFLVDTGADITTVPSHLLPVLGLKKSRLHANNTSGVGGISIKSWDFKMPIKLGNKELLIACSAVDTKEDSMPLLLGRKD